ncbi:pectate lyase D [Plectosphaerella plurivora]|uniref:Pectate lyase n=1 Tax=Plectosphaerella plurivora TaxID=936078 RepID=A0A9P8VH49_9PEZI|nr:pectate lyase D [Plectosphaerella plurivora]
MQPTQIIALLAALPAAMACLGDDSGIPKASSTKSLDAPQTIKAGETFDGEMARFDRGTPCSSGEGGEADTVFILEDGATLRNVIIGADQGEGIYCKGSCNIEMVWFEDVCEDAISIKGDGTANIIGGGAYGASDKIIQHNGCGHVNVENFYAENYGKVYRSCGNCVGNCARTVSMKGVTAVNGGELMGINPNMGDKATFSNNCFPKTECQAYEGCDKANGACEPKKSGKC